MSVGDNIKRRRYELKMSQQELADAMGYKTRSTIAKIESGENDVSQRKLQKFAQVLETTPEALIGGYARLGGSVHQTRSTGDGENVVVILAGGKSGRNRQNIPSQFVTVHGKPILVYCMEVYQNHPAIDHIYVVCLRGWENIVRAYAEEYGISKLRDIVPPGSTGMTSLRNGLAHVRTRHRSSDLVIVQEATRPMVTAETVSRLLQAGAEKGSATICHSMNEYVQFDISGENPSYIDRSHVIALQSPEIHRLSVMEEVFRKAHRLEHPLNESSFTMLMHNLNFRINFIESTVNNIKITREEDLAAFSTLLRDTI